MTPELRDRLIDELGIDILFTDCSKIGIRVCWGRYLEISRVINHARSIHEAGNWPVDLPSFSEVLIIEVFISNRLGIITKANFADQKVLSRYDQWLNQDMTTEDEIRTPGGISSKYMLEDLKEFLDLGGRLKKTRTQSEHAHLTKTIIRQPKERVELTKRKSTTTKYIACV